MKYEFVYQRLHDWSYEEKFLINQAIELVLTPKTEYVIRELAIYLADLTKVKYVTISKTVPHDSTLLQTVAYLENGRFIDNVSYSIIGTPCENVLSHSICYYPTGIQEEFPQDVYLQYLGVHSYMGTALNDPEGNTIGLIALLHDTTIENPGFIDHIVTILAPLMEEHLLAALI